MITKELPVYILYNNYINRLQEKHFKSFHKQLAGNTAIVFLETVFAIINFAYPLTHLVLKLKYSIISRSMNTMAACALAPCVTKPSAAMSLTMMEKQPHVFHEEGFQ